MSDYLFNIDDTYKIIKNDWEKFMKSIGATKCIIGISGGIDSTTCAALACKIFGKDNVYGVSMPCGEQHDILDVFQVFECLGIKRYDLNIEDAFCSIRDGVENNAIEVSEQTKINLPARLRMATLYAFAQSLNAVVINTCNISETLMGYDTLWGDDCGSYAPIKNLTKTEVRSIASYLGVPVNLVNKTPIDGLQAASDEERFGFTYSVLDHYIRTGNGQIATIANIIRCYNASKFKIDIINIQGPSFDFPDYIQGKNL